MNRRVRNRTHGGVGGREGRLSLLPDGMRDLDSISDATLVLDHVNPFSDTPLTDVDNLTALGDTLFFTASANRFEGVELWKTDGTVLGAARVKDIRPFSFAQFLGAGSDSQGSEPAELTVFQGELYFTADEGANGRELWKSDGTEEGTKLVFDVNPGDPGSDPRQLTVVGDTLYFRASDPFSGSRLYSFKSKAGGR